MQKTNNIYEYKTKKNKNEESHYFSTKGRITTVSFLLRLLFSLIIYSILWLIFNLYALPKYFEKIKHTDDGREVIYDNTFKVSFNYFEQFYFFILPIILVIFIIIQGVKRIHDTNKTGWFVLIPFYNLILLFSKGSIGSNEYGIDPKPNKKVKYYDEIKD